MRDKNGMAIRRQVISRIEDVSFNLPVSSHRKQKENLYTLVQDIKSLRKPISDAEAKRIYRILDFVNGEIDTEVIDHQIDALKKIISDKRKGVNAVIWRKKPSNYQLKLEKELLYLKSEEERISNEILICTSTEMSLKKQAMELPENDLQFLLIARNIDNLKERKEAYKLMLIELGEDISSTEKAIFLEQEGNRKPIEVSPERIRKAAEESAVSKKKREDARNKTRTALDVSAQQSDSDYASSIKISTSTMAELEALRIARENIQDTDVSSVKQPEREDEKV